MAAAQRSRWPEALTETREARAFGKKQQRRKPTSQFSGPHLTFPHFREMAHREAYGSRHPKKMRTHTQLLLGMWLLQVLQALMKETSDARSSGSWRGFRRRHSWNLRPADGQHPVPLVNLKGGRRFHPNMGSPQVMQPMASWVWLMGTPKLGNPFSKHQKGSVEGATQRAIPMTYTYTHIYIYTYTHKHV